MKGTKKKDVCPDCGGDIKYSNLEHGRYICKECNGIYEKRELKMIEV